MSYLQRTISGGTILWDYIWIRVILQYTPKLSNRSAVTIGLENFGSVSEAIIRKDINLFRILARTWISQAYISCKYGRFSSPTVFDFFIEEYHAAHKTVIPLPCCFGSAPLHFCCLTADQQLVHRDYDRSTTARPHKKSYNNPCS